MSKDIETAGSPAAKAGRTVDTRLEAQPIDNSARGAREALFRCSGVNEYEPVRRELMEKLWKQVAHDPQ